MYHIVVVTEQRIGHHNYMYFICICPPFPQHGSLLIVKK